MLFSFSLGNSLRLPFLSFLEPSFLHCGVHSLRHAPCSHSNPLLSRQGAALAHLDSIPPYDLIIWTDGFVPFPIPFPFRQAQYVQVFLLKPAPLCKLSASLGSTNKSTIPLPFSYSPIFATLFSPPSFLLPESLRQICLLFLPVLSGYNGERCSCLCNHLYPSLFSPLVTTLFFSRTGVSFKFFNTRVSSISAKKLVLPRHPHCVLSRLRCNGHSLLLKLLSLYNKKDQKSFMQRQRSSFPGHLLSHNLLSSCRLFGDPLSLYSLWSRSWGVARLLGLRGLPPYPHHSRGGN